MSDENDTAWPPALWSEQFQELGEEAAEQQMQLFRQMMQAGGAGSSATQLPGMGSLGMGAAVFKSRVQSGGRISIPDAEREALDIGEGDLVQAVVVPISSGD
jgi:hypothetical protein